MRRYFSVGIVACIAFIATFFLVISGHVQAATTTHQGPDHWVVLKVQDAEVVDGRLAWDFELEEKGPYVVQVISTGELAKATVEVDGVQFQEVLKKDFVIEAGTVSEFKRSVSLKSVGKHRLTIETSVALKQLRIVPHFSNSLGSGEYHSQWLAMHQSKQKQAAMAWFKEAKFGMFIHWGLYSQAGGIWKGTRIEQSPYPGPRVAEWLMSTFRIPRAEYAELSKNFQPDHSFAENIARLAKDAGMKYVVITAKHHDGFALFDSACSQYDMMDATPYKGDAIKELYEACLAEGLEFGVYYSHGNDWQDGSDGNYASIKSRNDVLGIYTHPRGKNLWDPSPNTHAEYLENKAYLQIAELVKMMPRLRLIWFDGDGFVTEAQSFRFYKMIFDLNPNVIVNRRVGHGFGDYLDAGDNKIPGATEVLDKHWETCGTTNNSWGYKSYDDDWKSTRELLYYFIDIASKGGNYLLNIGPDGRGQVPAPSARHLREVGQWLAINGEAIYGSTRWKVLHEGAEETQLEGTGQRAAKGFSRRFTPKDFWFTAKGDTVYAISLVRSGDTVRIRSLNQQAGTIQRVRLLGSDQAFPWKQNAAALELDFKDVKTSENGFVVEILFR
ncbi:alpha-L-fucosidase [Novipirellula artificiosorum]|uniref:alpha-L-fucosidase n=1 Tax=Novipirellula artificiosorum TaxID=2528016 RepID=A0A5C6D5A5_9BACT|nr:alpha-L-fucosidase [Novipirellula artificiosorum]TWU30867.1 Alpha-L-fucosidase [Novipirellula artificiosorum]